MPAHLPQIIADPTLDRDVLRPRSWFAHHRIGSPTVLDRRVRSGQLPNRKQGAEHHWSVEEVVRALAEPWDRAADPVARWLDADTRKPPPAPQEAVEALRKGLSSR